MIDQVPRRSQVAGNCQRPKTPSAADAEGIGADVAAAAQ